MVVDKFVLKTIKDFLNKDINEYDLVIFPLSKSSSKAHLEIAIFLDAKKETYHERYSVIHKRIIEVGTERWGYNKGLPITRPKRVSADLIKITYDDLSEEKKKEYNELMEYLKCKKK